MEEIESLGNSDRRAIASFPRLIAMDALNLKFHPAQEFQGHWRQKTRSLRNELARLLEESPNLFVQQDAIHARAWRNARREFAQDLEEDTPGAIHRFAAQVPTDAAPRYDLDTQILNEDWFPTPPPA
jgi:hypothetical protein